MRHRPQRPARRLGILAAASILVIAACGGDDDDAATTTPATDAPATTAAPGPEPTDAPASTAAPAPEPTDAPAGEEVISLAETSLGEVIVAADGFTLYLFVPDEGGEPTCVGGCAGTWPPYLVDEGADLAVGEGLDASLVSTVAHPDGGTMLVYGDWPLYYYAPDQEPGDVNGQGVNDLWYVVDAAGDPVR